MQHEFGVTFEPGWRGWLDVFSAELLLVWFDQHAVLEARMAHIFDAFDKVGCGQLVILFLSSNSNHLPIKNSALGLKTRVSRGALP